MQTGRHWVTGQLGWLALLAAATTWADTANPLLDRAHWIWWDTDANGYYRGADVDPAITDAARKEFHFTRDVELPAAVRTATLWITAQNLYLLKVNGKEVGRDGNWMSLEAYDLKPCLVAGRNRIEVIAVWAAEHDGLKAVDPWWAPGLFCAARVELADGKTVEVLADESWDCTNAAGMTKKAELVVRGVDGGYWNNCNRLFEMPERWYKLNTDLAPPAIAWARPYAGGRVKVLALLPRALQRDLIELQARADVDVQCVFTDLCQADARYGGTRAPFFPETKGARRDEVAAALAAALTTKPDVVVFGGVDRDLFYAVVAEPLKALVQGGAGLVYHALPTREVVAADGRKQQDASYEKELTATRVEAAPPTLATSVPFARLPGFKLKPGAPAPGYQQVASLYQCGQGRVVALRLSAGRYGTLADAADPSDLHYEYYQSFALKALLWAARREPVVTFAEFPAALTVAREQPGELAFGLAGAKAGPVTLAIRSPERLYALPAAPLPAPGQARGAAVLRPVHTATAPAAAAVRFALPRLPAGEYFLDVQVGDGKAVATWATTLLTVTATPALTALTLAAPTIDVADGKAAVVQARATLTGPAPADASVYFALLDNHDRVLAEQTVRFDPAATSAEAVFLVRRFDTCLGKARAELRLAGETADLRVARFTALRRDWDRFGLYGTYGGWGESHEGNVKARVMAALGFDAGFSNVSLDSLEAADLLPITGTYGINPRAPIDLDATRLEGLRQKMRVGMAGIAPFDPVAYVCGDELDYGGGDELPSRVSDYRENLKKRYQKIEALNQQWGTTHKTFDDVYPVVPEKKIATLRTAREAELKRGATPAGVDPDRFVPQEALLKEAATSGNYAQYLDLWLNNYRVFADQYRLATAMARESNPHARIGTWAPMWPFAATAHDWATFVQDMGCFAPYGREGEMLPMEDARSFAPPGTALGLCYGGYLYMGFARRTQLLDLEWQKWRIWSGLLRGFTSVWWYSLGHGGNESGMSPGLLPFPCLEVASAEAARMRRGAYHVFTRARRQYGPVALHYSIPSRLLASAIGDFGEQPWDFHFLLRIMQDEVGQQYTFVSSQQIAAGELAKYRVLIMPLALAIDPAEAKALTAFVQGGGLLIADVRPGLANGHGNLNDCKAMTELFGVTYKPTLGRRNVTGAVSGTYRGVAFTNPVLKLPVDPALELKGAQAAVTVDGVPLVVWREVGKGAAVCLNLPFNYYRGYPTPDHLYLYYGEPRHNRMLGTVLSALLAAHQIERPVKVTVPQGAWLWGLDTPYHVDGAAQYVSLTRRRQMPDEAGGYAVTLQPPKSGHVYDMTTGKYLGQQERWTVQVAAADVQLFAVLPYAVTGLTATPAAPTAARGGELRGAVQVQTGGAPAERHFVHLAVKRPDGQVLSYLDTVLETRAGRATYALPLALNDVPGAYTLEFCDAATLVKTTVTVSVQ